jgi:DnaK suppressor protein
VKKPVAKAAPVSKPVIKKKTAAAKQGAPASKKASATKPAAPKAVAKAHAPAKPAAARAAPSAPSKPAGRAAPSASTSSMKKTAAASASTVVATPPASAAPSVNSVNSANSATALPPRSARPSSRLAQVTVPSMPQAVASTAAKSSFVQMAVQPLAMPAPVAIKKDPKLANNWKTKAAEALTDPEVIAMPDSEYMNEKQMAFFRLKLEALKRGILDNAGETTEHLREDTVVVPDPADRATIEEEHALELRTRDRERKLLKKIEQSIQRIDSGDYGYCDETGEPIGVGRLLARPTATLSLEAQQRRELKQKMFGD